MPRNRGAIDHCSETSVSEPSGLACRLKGPRAGVVLAAATMLLALSAAHGQGTTGSPPSARPAAAAPAPSAAPQVLRPSATLGPAAPGVPGPASTGSPPKAAPDSAATAAAPNVAGIARYRSVSKPEALMFDAPSDKARKLFVAPQGMPVAVISVLRTWVKVRDPLGDIAWISRDDLTDRRMVMATAPIPLRREAETNAPAWFSVDRGVVLELLDDQPVNGFVKVRYAEGQVGYLPKDQVWGL
jgi:SH3-like domain-containing protein